MKITPTLAKIVLLLTLLVGSPAATFASDIMMVITPHLPDREAKNKVYNQVVTYALKDLAIGQSLEVYDGQTFERVARLAVPDHKAYESQQFRVKEMKADIQRLGQWIVSTPQNIQEQYALDVTGIFRFLRMSGAINKQVILVGSPIYTQASEPAFSMKGDDIGFYYTPSDSHLAASPADTVFGLEGQDDTLKGLKVHWAYVESQPFRDGKHEHGVQRFWTAFMQYQGAQLVTCSASLDTAMERVNNSADSSAIMTVTPDFDSKAEMIYVPRVQRYFKKDNLPSHDESDQPEFLTSSKIAARAHSDFLSQKTKIGIRWIGDSVDLDLFVRPTADAKELFFGYNRSAEGAVHQKDFRASPNPNNGFETVTIPFEIDLRELAISVNTYKAAVPEGEIHGLLRIEVDGELYEKEFMIPTGSGNKGKDQKGNRNHSKYWAVFDPLQIVQFAE